MLLKFLAYGFVIAIYGLFAWFGKAPVDGFIAVLTGALAMLGGVHAYSTASKNATDAANHANPVPPPRTPIAPTTVTTGADYDRATTLTGAQGGFARLPFLMFMAVVSAFFLAACVTSCGSDQHCARDAAEDIGAGLGVALDILAIPAEVDQTTTTTTRTCAADRHGDKTCTTTQVNQ